MLVCLLILPVNQVLAKPYPQNPNMERASEVERLSAIISNRLRNPCTDNVTGDIVDVLKNVKDKGDIALEHAKAGISAYVSIACLSDQYYYSNSMLKYENQNFKHQMKYQTKSC